MDLDVDVPRLSAGQRLAGLDTLLLLVFPHLFDPDSFSRTCHAFRDVSLTHSAIWSWYIQRYFRCQLLSDLTRRPRLVTSDVIDVRLSRHGAGSGVQPVSDAEFVVFCGERCNSLARLHQSCAAGAFVSLRIRIVSRTRLRLRLVLRAWTTHIL